MSFRWVFYHSCIMVCLLRCYWTVPLWHYPAVLHTGTFLVKVQKEKNYKTIMKSRNNTSWSRDKPFYFNLSLLLYFFLKHVCYRWELSPFFSSPVQKGHNMNIWGLFAKFVDSPYYSELDLCGGVVTVSFQKYLPWQVLHFLQCSTHFLKTCCRLLVTSKFFALELPFHA
jgi:hypothetical protein